MLEYLLRKLGFTSEIPAPAGPHKEVGVLPFRFPGSTYTKIFYPAVAPDPKSPRKPSSKSVLQRIEELHHYNTSKRGKYRYTRANVLAGMTKFSGTSTLVFKLTMGHNKVNYKFALEPRMRPEKYPVVLFSHGLAGNADIYSKFCSDVASLGYIVIAMEHEDGSGSFAFDGKTGEKIYFTKAPKDLVYDRPNAIEFRAPFLKKRTEEIAAILEFILNFENKAKEKSQDLEKLFKLDPDLEKKIFSLMKTDEIHMAGHSFGGTTTLTAVHHFHTKEEGHQLKSIFKSATLLDVWAIPVSEAVMNNGVEVPFISILSEQFVNGNEFPAIETFLANSSQHCKLSTYMKGTTHTQFSDGPWWTELKLMKKKGSLEGSLPGIESQRSITEAVKHFLADPGSFSFKKIEKSETHLIQLKPSENRNKEEKAVEIK